MSPRPKTGFVIEEDGDIRVWTFGTSRKGAITRYVWNLDPDVADDTYGCPPFGTSTLPLTPTQKNAWAKLRKQRAARVIKVALVPVEKTARVALRYADAMLRERAQADE